MAKYVLDFINIFVGLRKSIVMLLLMAISTTLITKGFLSGANFTDLLRATIISYFGANGVEHFTSMVQAHLNSKTGTTTPETVIVAKEES